MSPTAAAVLALARHACRWPYGDPGADDFRFCGRGKVEGRPYCPDHELVSVGLKPAKSVPRPADAQSPVHVVPVARRVYRQTKKKHAHGEFRDRLLDALRACAQGGDRPAYRELANALGTSTDQVRGHMQRLEQRGWIQRAPFRVLVPAQGEAA